MITYDEMPIFDQPNLSNDLTQLAPPLTEKDGVKIYKRGEGPVTHTIFGRLIKGHDTIHLIEGMADLKRNKVDVSERLINLPAAMGTDIFSIESKAASE